MKEISNEDALYICKLYKKEPIEQMMFGTDKERNIYRTLKRIGTNIERRNKE